MYAIFHADASPQRGSSIHCKKRSGGSMAIPQHEGQERTRKYRTHDVLFVFSYIKLNCFMCIFNH